MAITKIEYALFKLLRDQNAIPLNAEVLELGEANWYGDVNIEILGQDIYRYALNEKTKNIFCQLDQIVATQPWSSP